MRNRSNPPTPPARRPWRVAPLALAALLVLAPALHAQQAAPIAQQMTPEQFKAAGLDRLDPQQLRNLDAWLNRAIEAQAGKAAETARQQVKEENRGFLNFGSSEPINGRISGEFRGFAHGRSYTLDSGHVWQQVDNASLSGVRIDAPEVRITPSMVGNVWYMTVDRYNTRAKVERIK